MDKAMSDVGIVEFLNGSVMLDDHFRPRFLGASASCKSSGVAIVILSQLDEIPALRTLSLPIDFAGREHQERSAALLSGVIREFHSQSAAFRSLR
jgi:hypothetical protein